VLRVRGKGRKTRTIVAAPPVVHAIHAMTDERARELGVTRVELPGDSPMFPGDTAGRLSRWQVLRIVRRIVRAAGVESWRDISPHSLRHACLTLMLDAGQDIHRVADHAGHATVGTTERYDRNRGRLARTPVHALVGLLDAAD
jgi:site-specific recombinase XerD